jgi:hypothetical protein
MGYEYQGRYPPGSAKLAEVRAAVSFWGGFELEKKREEWRDGAMQISQMQEAGAGSKKDLADKAGNGHTQLCCPPRHPTQTQLCCPPRHPTHCEPSFI